MKKSTFILMTIKIRPDFSSVQLHTPPKFDDADILPRPKSHFKDEILPLSHFLIDAHGRGHDYLRISITERYYFFKTHKYI